MHNLKTADSLAAQTQEVLNNRESTFQKFAVDRILDAAKDGEWYTTINCDDKPLAWIERLVNILEQKEYMVNTNFKEYSKSRVEYLYVSWKHKS